MEDLNLVYLGGGDVNLILYFLLFFWQILKDEKKVFQLIFFKFVRNFVLSTCCFFLLQKFFQ